MMNKFYVRFLLIISVACTLSSCWIPVGLLSSNARKETAVTTFIGDDGYLYIDIPERKKYKSAHINFISIFTKDANGKDKYYWSIIKKLDLQHLETPVEIGDKFPLRYGALVPGTAVYQEPKKLVANAYGIRGGVFFYNEEGQLYREFRGDFVFP